MQISKRFLKAGIEEKKTFNALQYGVDLEIVGISVVSSFFKIMGLNSLLESTRRIQLNIYLFY